jgi:hypothetical protein
MASRGRNAMGLYLYDCDDCGVDCSVGTPNGPPNTATDEKTRCCGCHRKHVTTRARVEDAADDMLEALKKARAYLRTLPTGAERNGVLHVVGAAITKAGAR